MRRAETTAHALAERCEEVAAALLGPPTSTTKQELRFGRRGSFALCRNAAKRGLWYDHERGESHASMELHFGTRSSLLSAITSALPSPRPGGWYHPHRPHSRKTIILAIVRRCVCGRKPCRSRAPLASAI